MSREKEQRDVARYEVDRATGTVIVVRGGVRAGFVVRAIGDASFEVLEGARRIGTFEVDAREDGGFDAYVAAEDGVDADLVRSIVRAARRGGVAP